MQKIVKCKISYVVETQDALGSKYICSAELRKGRLTVSTPGEGRTLEEAMNAARDNAFASWERLENMSSSQSFQESSEQKKSHRESSLEKFNGGGSKPASPRQQNLIQKLAEERGVELYYFVQQICGVDLRNLTGADANKLIKQLKSRAQSAFG